MVPRMAPLSIHEDESSSDNYEVTKRYLSFSYTTIIRLATTNYILQVIALALQLCLAPELHDDTIANGAYRNVLVESFGEGSYNLRSIAKILRDLIDQLESVGSEAHKTCAVPSPQVRVVCTHVVGQGTGLDKKRTDEFHQKHKILLKGIMSLHLNDHYKDIGLKMKERFIAAFVAARMNSAGFRMDAERVGVFLETLYRRQSFERRYGTAEFLTNDF
ncbi:hypothetical protein BJ878DRAFT_561439 [Calycina marina]|uniref:Uncharacterized protein n=1 Tax=Calycina marina TaxID=1763456 RepID=A0A9P7Z6I6_9HELO|nr:hypothetical protein BJ878DRAFT_561439 [Calycina marina]